ncbi:MAG: PaaI family thioesterase [Sphingomonadaceae bacterium]|uniref:PaaI family thioesterase n=1 Tax=Thermaurantiacus sp. TaxID=2820283 RepID=UPI00298F276A|nr:PaaI family thioesterase [Thermaurantiacus sp.]MCS6985951.1 PaaI family thioesterase [Sphingomonadaceae bacterium]MDW8414833.1 PaaI family thioesterase [Thermaurantiacus sp.]
MPALPVEEGPWKGWKCWHARPEGRFVDHLGDVYYREEGGEVVSAIETARRHANGLGFLHGGFLMAFVDVAMFATIRHLLETQAAVTLQCSVDFLGPGHVGRTLFGRGHIVQETGKLVWVAGFLEQEGDAGGPRHRVCAWHGVLRKVPRMAR